jgi:glycosyltransferase involved in cell wall biosynthesis
MRIAIDGRTILQQRTGVGEYTERVVRHLLQIDSVNEYYLFLAEPLDELSAQNLTKVVRPKSNRMGRNRIWENFILPRFLSEHDVQIYFSPAFTLPVVPRIGKYLQWLPLPRSMQYIFNTDKRVKYVVTIHDVIAYIFPQYFTMKMRLWTKIFISNAVNLADKILTDSDATQRDLTNLFPGKKMPLQTVYPSLNEKYRRIGDQATLQHAREQLQVPVNFILYVGTIEPRKNVLSIAQAYALLPEHLQKEYTLILSGGRGWFSDPIIEQIESLKLHGNIRMPGYVPHNLLPSLYNLATLFVFPSLYEGFGYPPLEAMACGVPVITSDRSSLSEVVGNAGKMVDPTDVNKLAKEMQQILENEPLRQTMITKGIERAKKFSAEATASQIMNVFDEVMREQRSR